MTRVAGLARPALAFACAAVAGCMAFHPGPLPNEPKVATFASVEGARVRFVDVGSGPPVVLVHGFASSLNAWDPVIPALAKEHRVLALDLKGFGWTDRPEGDYSPAAQAKLVLALLDQRGIAHAAFVGHSWGSSVVLAAALAAPERIERIALYDAFVYEEQLPLFFTMSRASGVGEALFGMFYDERPDERLTLAFYDPNVVTEPFAEHVDEMVSRPGTKAAALAAVRGLRYTDVEPRYRGIEKPTLLLWGREDVVTPVAIGERLVRDLPHARLVVYPRCGHFPMIEARSASTTELVSFLAPAAPGTAASVSSPADPPAPAAVAPPPAPAASSTPSPELPPTEKAPW